MKKTILLTTLTLLFFLPKIQAQDFTVSVPLTDDHSGYFKPLRKGASLQFQVNIKNNTSETCTVSIDKFYMNYLSSWITIEDNNKEILPQQEREFLLTLIIPPDVDEGEHMLQLYFDITSKDNNSYDFNSFPQVITIDNTPPIIPTFETSARSKTMRVYSISSYDDLSSSYDEGYKGITNYIVKVKDTNGSEIRQKTIGALSNSHTFNGLSPNTNYFVSVTATDLAGNTSTKEKGKSTAPAKPTNLQFSNITYIDAFLSWNPSEGATGYNIFKVTDQGNEKINESPISGNSYKIEGLDPNTAYDYNVIALSDAGKSDRSNNKSVTTIALPTISGSNTMCTGKYTYSVAPLIDGYTVSWSYNYCLKKRSSSGSSATFVKNITGQGELNANISAPNGRILELTQKRIWVGKPALDGYISGGSSIECPGTTQIYSFTGNIRGASSSSWVVSGHFDDISNSNSYVLYIEPTNNGKGYVTLVTQNACGENFLCKEVKVTGTDCFPALKLLPSTYSCGISHFTPPLLSVSPNPADEYMDVKINEGPEKVSQLQNSDEKVYVKLPSSL